MKKPEGLFIVKIQRAVATTHPGGSILVYNEDRSVMWEQEETPDMVALIHGQLKRYFWATIIGTELAIMNDKPAPEQDW